MPIEAFGARRVTESLRSINGYLEQVVAIAGGIPPGQIATQTLVTVPGTASPQLTNVVWKLASGATSSSIPRGDVKNGVTVVVTAANLSHFDTLAKKWVPDIRFFKVVGPGAGTTYLEANAASISDVTQTGFYAALHFVAGATPLPPVGLYEAFVVHTSGQPALLRNACEVLEPKYLVRWRRPGSDWHAGRHSALGRDRTAGVEARWSVSQSCYARRQEPRSSSRLVERRFGRHRPSAGDRPERRAGERNHEAHPGV